MDEAEPFKKPVTQEDLGGLEQWENYQAHITYPIDLCTIRLKIFEGEYVGVGNFEFDKIKLFDNCKKFNDPKSDIYDNAESLEDMFTKMFKSVKKRFIEKSEIDDFQI